MTANLNEQIRELIDTGARAVSPGEIMARQPATVASLGPDAARPRHGPRRTAAIAAGAAAAGTAAVIAVALLGGTADREPSGREPHGRVGTVLTAAMVRQVAAASGTALAHAGHLRIVYSDISSLDPAGRSAGTDDITFSGKDWNDISDQTAPPNGTSINRFVGGRLYYHGRGFERNPGSRLHWYRETNPSEVRQVRSVTAPDPRRLLHVLDPAARFVLVGHQVIGGVRVEQLRATRLAHLPGLDALPGGASPIGRVTSLDVWVDGHGVIRRMHLTSQKHIKTSNRKRLFVIKKNGTVKLKTVGPRVPVRHGVERASAWVSFVDIGQHQTITAPAHAIPRHGIG
jgi:hypothetical protein